MILVLNTKQTQRYQHENRRRGLADAAITDFTRTSAITKHACNLDTKKQQQQERYNKHLQPIVHILTVRQ